MAFPQGYGRLIPGFDQGFAGMKIGGKRRIFIPWQLAYGEKGRVGPDPAHPVIPPKADLIFDVELVDIGEIPGPPNRAPIVMKAGKPIVQTPGTPGAPSSPAQPGTPAPGATPPAPGTAPSTTAPPTACGSCAPAAPPSTRLRLSRSRSRVGVFHIDQATPGACPLRRATPAWPRSVGACKSRADWRTTPRLRLSPPAVRRSMTAMRVLR